MDDEENYAQALNSGDGPEGEFKAAGYQGATVKQLAERGEVPEAQRYGRYVWH